MFEIAFILQSGDVTVQATYQSDSSSLGGLLQFDKRESNAIFELIREAAENRYDVGIAAGGTFVQDVTVALFDVTGFADAYNYLPCS